MKMKTLFTSAMITLVAALSFAGCANVPAPDNAPDVVLKDGMANLATLTSYKYDLSMNGDVSDPTSGDVKFNFKVNGAIDVKDMKDPKVSVNLDGSANDSEGSGGTMKAELMMNNKAVYFNLKNLDLGEEGLLPPEVTDYMGKWWMVTLPEGTMDELSLASAEDLYNEDVKKALEDSKFFATPEYVGGENVMGDPSWHYKVNLDKKAFLEFMKDVAESQGESISATEFSEAETAFDNVDMQGDVWVSTTSKVLNQFKGSITYKGAEGEPSGTMALTFSLGDINKPVTLNIPSGAEEFPLDEIAGPLMMMSGMGDPSMYDDSAYGDFDPSMYDDSAYGDFDPSMFDESAVSDFDPAEFDAAMAELEGMQDDL